MKKYFWAVFALIIFTAGCNNNNHNILNGRLEGEIVQITALTGGKIATLNIEEGDHVSQNYLIAVIDNEALRLKQSQQDLKLQEIALNLIKLKDQINQTQSELDFARDQLQKTERMLKKGAATSQVRDELKTKTEVLTSQEHALSTQAKILQNQKEQMEVAIKLTQKQLEDTYIKTPISGEILNKYHNQGENISPGGLIAEIADLSNLTAIIYIPFSQLPIIKIGQRVQISVTGHQDKFSGKVKWIASEAEFTPKTIMTQETQTSLVYRVKIDVPNPSGKLKIGMPVNVILEITK